MVWYFQIFDFFYVFQASALRCVLLSMRCWRIFEKVVIDIQGLLLLLLSALKSLCFLFSFLTNVSFSEAVCQWLSCLRKWCFSRCLWGEIGFFSLLRACRFMGSHQYCGALDLTPKSWGSVVSSILSDNASRRMVDLIKVLRIFRTVVVDLG